MSGQKRKMDQVKSFKVQKTSSKKGTKAIIVPGVTRTSGFYGRYLNSQKPEDKFFDTALSFTVDTTGEVPATGQLTLIPQGVTESTRVGRKCTIKSIQIRGIVTYAPGASAQAAAVNYIYIVQDTQCNGAAAAVTDVLTSATMSSGLINMANSQRFRILKRLVMSFNPPAGATTAYNSAIKPFEYFKRCNIPVEFSSTTGAITEIRSNNIFLLAGAAGTNADDLCTVSGVARLKFSDM